MEENKKEEIKSNNNIENNKELSDNKNKFKIVIVLGIILIILVTILVIRKNIVSDVPEISEEVIEEVELDYYYKPEDNFFGLQDVGNYKTDTVIFADTVDRLKEKKLSDGIIINTMDEFINYANMCTECRYACGVGIPVSEEYFKSGSLIVYMHNKETSVAGMKISEISKSDNSLKLYLSVAEGDAQKVTDGRNAEVLYLFTEKVNANTKLEIITTSYGVEIKSKEKEDKIYPNQEIEIPINENNVEFE